MPGARRGRVVRLEWGEGSAFTRKSGARAGQIVACARSLATGKRRYWTVNDLTRQPFRSEQEAREFLRRAHVAMEDDAVASANPTVAAYLEEWLAAARRRGLAENTLRAYRGNVRSHIVPALGALHVADVTPAHVQSLLDGLGAACPPLAPSSINLCRRVLRAALSSAVDRGLVARNTAAGRAIQPPRVKKRDPTFLAPGQARALLSAASGTPHEIAFLLALCLALREGEILSLRRRDLDLDRRRLHVPGTKTVGSRQAMPIPAYLVPELTRCLDARAARFADLGADAGPDSLLVTPDGSRPLDRRRLLRHLARALARAGLPKIRFHDLRHSCASILLDAGASMREVQEILRHENIQTTMGTYAHLMPNARERALDRLDTLIPPPEK